MYVLLIPEEGHLHIPGLPPHGIRHHSLPLLAAAGNPGAPLVHAGPRTRCSQLQRRDCRGEEGGCWPPHISRPRTHVLPLCLSLQESLANQPTAEMLAEVRLHQACANPLVFTWFVLT